MSWADAMVPLAGLAINVCFALLCHAFLRQYVLASAAAGLVTTTTWQVLNYWHLGYLDPFVLIAFVFGGGVAFAVSLVVGVPFLVVRGRRPVPPPQALDRGFEPAVGQPQRPSETPNE